MSFGFGPNRPPGRFASASGSPDSNESIVGVADDGTTGYWEAATDGGVFSFNAPFYGSKGGQYLAAPVAGVTATEDLGGYWLFGTDGGVFTFGDAPYEGSIPGAGGSGGPQTVALVSPNGQGYWEVDADGGVFSFNETFHGSLPPYASTLAVVSAAVYEDGYCLLWDTGRIDCFTGSGAHSVLTYGSDSAYTDPAVGLSSTSDGAGLWAVTAEGQVSAYGDAIYEGQLASVPVGPIFSISGWDNTSYTMVGADGGTFNFNTAYEGNAYTNPELSPAAAQHVGLVMLPQRGWGTAAEWAPDGLDQVWTWESAGWQWNICAGGGHYPNCDYTYGAYGIPQADPGYRMCDPGYDPGEPPCTQDYANPWETNAWTQINWGFWYIATRYQDPEGAYRQETHCGTPPCGYLPAGGERA
ncbi:MAG: hypothetical protein ACRDYY_02020 [Acidimicrobiales bacterium]